MLLLADARVRAARGACRQPRRHQMWPRRCAPPVASGCRPDVAGGRLCQLAAPPGGPSRATSSSSAAGGSSTARWAPGAAAAPPARSSRRPGKGAATRPGGPEAARGGASCPAWAAAMVSRAPVRCAQVARTPRAPQVASRTSCACCMSRLYALCLLCSRARMCVRFMPSDVMRRRSGRFLRPVFARACTVRESSSYFDRNGLDGRHMTETSTWNHITSWSPRYAYLHEKYSRSDTTHASRISIVHRCCALEVRCWLRAVAARSPHLGEDRSMAAHASLLSAEHH